MLAFTEERGLHVNEIPPLIICPFWKLIFSVDHFCDLLYNSVPETAALGQLQSCGGVQIHSQKKETSYS